ncbi:hypothetical protein [Sulfurimonas sp.]
MNISTNSNKIVIEGNIKSISDYQSIKSSIDAVIATNKSIVIELKDSLSLTSSVIGYLNMIILKNKISVQLLIGDNELYDLLHDLNLASVFNAKKV